MEEISISWRHSGRGIHSSCGRSVFLAFLLGLCFLIPIRPVSASDSDNAKAKTSTGVSSEITTVASASIPIKPVVRSKSDRFNGIIKRAAEQYKVEPALIKAVIMTESAYNPKAVSKQGAKGLMQLMPGTARALGVKNAFNPAHNIHGGVKYLRQLLDAFDHNVKLAVAAYNAGISKVKRHGGVPPIKSTRYYVKKVFAYYHHYKSEMRGETKKV